MSEVELYMIPPAQKTVQVMPKRYLRFSDTHTLFFMDEQDWQKAKHIQWFKGESGPVNARGIRFEDYCGIKAPRKKDMDINDYRRSCYGGD